VDVESEFGVDWEAVVGTINGDVDCIDRSDCLLTGIGIDMSRFRYEQV